MKIHPFRTASLALATATLLAAPAAFADEVTHHEVTETRTVTGTVSEVTPSSRIVVMQSGSPTTYTLDQRTVFVDESGNVVTYDQVRGKPVKIYVSESREQPVVVERVVVTKPVTTTIHPTQPVPAAPPVTQRTETRTETTVTDD